MLESVNKKIDHTNFIRANLLEYSIINSSCGYNNYDKARHLEMNVFVCLGYLFFILGKSFCKILIRLDVLGYILV